MAEDQPSQTPSRLDAARTRTALEKLLASLPPSPLDAAGLVDNERKKLWAEVQIVLKRLETFAVELDLIALPPLMYNPADPDTFAESIGNKLLLQEPTALADVRSRKFYGSGVYALFYRGNYDAYRPIKGTHTPIYVGKANPAKAKKTKPKKGKPHAAEEGVAKTPRQQGLSVWSRLTEHADSIDEAETLDLADFDCRYLVTATGWQVAAEEHLIALFKPVWNKEMKICQGLGKHGDASETRDNRRSAWDTLHPGRPWAADAKENKRSVEQIKADIAEHYRRFPPRA